MPRHSGWTVTLGPNSDPAEVDDSQFPHFEDADTLIVLTGSRQFHLHRSTLVRISETLKALLADVNTAQLCRQAIKKGVNITNRLDAHPNFNRDIGLAITLRPVTLDENGKPLDAAPIRLDLENGLVVDPVYHAFDAVFGLFYHRNIDFGGYNVPLGEILLQAEEIVAVAEYLKVTKIVKKPLEAELSAHGQSLHRSIAKDPAAWLDFGCRIESKYIFKEALIHAVGRYNTAEMQEQMKNMEKPLRDLIQKKGDMLRKTVQNAVQEMTAYYPNHMKRSNITGRADIDGFGMSSYQKDIPSWMASVVFRQLLGQEVNSDQTHHAADLGYKFLSEIAKSGDAYLSKVDLNDFYHFFPMTTKGEAALEHQLSHIKEHMKGYISGLFHNNSQLDSNTYGREYFTCTQVDYLDFPWEAQAHSEGGESYGFGNAHTRPSDAHMSDASSNGSGYSSY